jgi:hypothetical protein
VIAFLKDIAGMVYERRHVMLLPVIILILFLILVIIFDRGGLRVPVVYAGF